MTYAAFYAIIMLPVMSLLSAFVLRRNLSVYQKLSADQISKGDTLGYEFTLTNNSFLLCTNVSVLFDADSAALVTDISDASFPIPPFRCNRLEYSVSAKYRGVYSVGVCEVILYDFLGIFKLRKKYAERLEFTVNPRITLIPSLPISSATQDAADVQNFLSDENYSVISDLRRYQPTDGYKKIHWKLSAKKGELISKNFQATQKTIIELIIDNSRIGGAKDSILALEDSMVEALVSVMAYCNEHDYPVQLYHMGSEISEAAKGSFEYLYATAAGMRFGEYGKFDEYFANYVRMQTDAASVGLFVQHISDGVVEAAKTLILFGNNVLVFVFSDDSHTKRNAAQLNELGVLCVRFDDTICSFQLGDGFHAK